MKQGCIYRITNAVNGKVYIGQTVNAVSSRWSQHAYNAKSGTDTHLYNAIRKHGIENFKIETIAEFPVECLNSLEAFYIGLYGSLSTQHGYNIQGGGDSVGSHSVETKAKISAASKGKTKSTEHRASLSAAKRGSRLSAETRARMSATRKGRTKSPEWLAKMAASQRGRTYSAETLSKMSAGQKRRFAKNNAGIGLAN